MIGIGIGLNITNLGGVRGSVNTQSLDFVNGVYKRNGVTYPDWATFLSTTGSTFTRSTVGYDTTAATKFAINTARISAVGLLYEATATNLVLNSQTFATSWGSGTIQITAVDNAVAAPDGTTTADTATSASAGQLRQFFGGPSAGSNYALSIFAKFASGNTDYTFADQVVGGVNFNASTTAVTANGTVITFNKISAANGYTRYYAIYTASTTAFPTLFSNAAAVLNIYGAQWEIIGSKTVPTSYFPTTTAAAARGADALSITLPAGLTGATVTFDDNSTQSFSGLTTPWQPTPASFSRSQVKSVVFS